MSEAVVVSPKRRRLALVIAIAADALQFVLLPLFPAIIPEILDDVIDVIVGVVMIGLLGWHWAFLPSFLTKLVPFVDILPTWTAAVWLVTRKGKTAKIEAPPVPKLP